MDFEKREGELVPQGARMLSFLEQKTGGPEQAFLGGIDGTSCPQGASLLNINAGRKLVDPTQCCEAI